MINSMNVKELKVLLDSKKDIELIDVRNPDEYELCNINGKLIPLGEIQNRYNEIDKNKQIIVMCHHGGRSMRACQFLESVGFTNLTNLEGGIHHWSLQIDDSVAVY